jgi:hypothetical protein
VVQAGLGFDIDTNTTKAAAEAAAEVSIEVNIKPTTSGLGYYLLI